MLLCYFTGGDIFAIYYLALSAVLMFVLLDDLTPAINVFLFMAVVVSYKNSPSYTAGNSDYYFRPAILSQIIVLVSLIVIACIYRLVKTCVNKKFKPTAVFYSLCALSAAFLLNGAFSKDYNIMNLPYGLLQCVLYLGIFSVFQNNLKPRKETFKYLANCFVALSILLLAELVSKYFDPQVFSGWQIDRDYITFGWGVRNTMGMMLLLCVPSVMYLASLYKRGYLLFCYSFVILAGCLLSMSRQTILGAVIIYPICLYMLFRHSKYRAVNAALLAVAAVAVLAVIIIFRDLVSDIIKSAYEGMFLNGELDGSGRIELYIFAAMDFSKAPLFGAGFFNETMLNYMDTTVSGLGINLHFYHNTILQMMASCGIVGLVCYTVHRAVTVMCLCRGINRYKSYIAVTILVILLLSLLDIHMLDIFPTFIYSYLLAMLAATGPKPQGTDNGKALFKN